MRRAAVVAFALCALWTPPARAAEAARIGVFPLSESGRTREDRAGALMSRRIVTDQLAQVPDVRVLSFGEAARVATRAELASSGRARNTVLREIGVQTGVDVAVGLEVEMSRGRWRVRSLLCAVADSATRAGPARTVKFSELADALGDVSRAAAELAGVDLSAEQLRRLRRVPTNDPHAFLAAGQAMAGLPGTPAAEAKALEAVRRDPDFVEAHMELGRIYFMRQEYGLAAAAYATARELRPGHPYTDYNLGLTYRALGDFARAIDAYERARIANPTDPDVLNNLGIAYYLQGDLSQAREVFRQALALSPYDRRVRGNLQAVEEALHGSARQLTDAAAGAQTPQPATPAPAPAPQVAAKPELPAPPPAQSHLETAGVFYARGEYERAMVEYELARAEWPNDTALLLALGRSYQQLGRYADAVGALNRVVELDPAHSEAARLLDEALAALTPASGEAAELPPTRSGVTKAYIAQTYFRKGKRHFVRGEYGGAITAYTRALQFAPADAAILNSLGVAQYEAGRADAAERTFARVMELAPNDAAAAQNLEALRAARDSARVRAAEDAGRLELLSVSLDPELEPELAFLRGNQAFTAGDMATAAAAFARAVALEPEHGAAWNNLGVVRVRTERYDEAAEAFAQAARRLHDPIVRENAEATAALARYAAADENERTLVIALNDDPDLHFRYRMATAREAYQREAYGEAAEEYEAIAAIFVDEPMPLTNLAACHYQLGRYADALAAVTLALRRNPDDPAAQHNRSVIDEALYLARLEEEGAAPPDASLLLEYTAPTTEAAQDPPELTAQLVAGERALAAGNLDAAEQAFMVAVRLAPGDVAAYRGLGRVRAAQRRWSDATEDFRRASDRLPQDFALAMAWGYAALRAGQAVEARRAFTRAVEAESDSAQARYNLAIAERRAGNLEAAIAASRAAVQLDPTFTDAAYNLANLYLEAQAWNDAVPAFRRVLTLDATNVGAYNNLAIAHWRRGEHDEALRLWREALAVDPQCEFARANLQRFTRLTSAAPRR